MTDTGKSAWEWTLERRLRFHARKAIRHLPGIYLPISRVRKRPFIQIKGREIVHTGVVGPDTDIVMEGLYRAGNTFAFVAFQLAQPSPVNVAHHLHAEAQIIKGVEMGKPVLTLIRNPESLIVSAVTSFGIPMKQALKDYVTFYSRLLPYKDYFVTADFTSVTRDFGKIINEINSKYHTNFVEFDHTEANVKKCFRVIDEFYTRTAPEPDRTVARPSAQRHTNKSIQRALFHSPSYRALREEAWDLYESMVSSSDGSQRNATQLADQPESDSSTPKAVA